MVFVYGILLQQIGCTEIDNSNILMWVCLENWIKKSMFYIVSGVLFCFVFLLTVV